ncbi:hypothetical protein RHSIM_Rhsim13G0160500 [Rhododendron simsii]|uniref:FAS1 domain-containing protein n=1 Tax=Rhododendron simsii TaxID=118357 RepID=A0A834FYC1_RHOSS|nr:hypothetical protein RHSIM_Rhsim13G0160500 [Rhododendron simsii]
MVNSPPPTIYHNPTKNPLENDNPSLSLLNFRSSSITTFTILILSLSSASAAAVPEQKLESMLTTLRTRGYTLFANAISATNLLTNILTRDFIHLLRPHRLLLPRFWIWLPRQRTTSRPSATTSSPVASQSSISDLFFPLLRITTLDPNHDVIQVQRRLVSDVIFVDGVDLVVPGLFYSGEVVVH